VEDKDLAIERHYKAIQELRKEVALLKKSDKTKSELIQYLLQQIKELKEKQ